MFVVQSRTKYFVNTDHLRRCYDGYHYKGEWRFGEWQDFGRPQARADAERRMKYLTEINNERKAARPYETNYEYRIKEVKDGTGDKV